jgi:two-component system LytT family response regulator
LSIGSVIPSTKKIDFIKIDNILYFESDGRYTIIHLTDNSTFFVSKNIGEYDKILAPNFFFRIHKKYLINLKYIININNSDGSNCQLLGDIILPVAKRRKEDLVFIFETLYISSPNSYPSFRLAQTSNFHYLGPFFLL